MQECFLKGAFLWGGGLNFVFISEKWPFKDITLKGLGGFVIH